MRRPPRDPARPILTGPAVAAVLALGAYIGGATLWVFAHYRTGHGAGGTELAQTVAFTTIILTEKMNVFNFRFLERPLRRGQALSNPWLIGAWAGMIGLHALVIYAPFFQRVLHTRPLAPEDWAHALALALPVFLLVEIGKRIRARREASG